tara:strand:+ start:377 stop:754 length:378 start_codon:yes stop_codon:yes gene_type:complete
MTCRTQRSLLSTLLIGLCISLGSGNISLAQEGFVVLEYRGNTSQTQNLVTSGDHYTVKRGDTLYSILRGKFGLGADIKALMNETVETNPHAFVRGNADALMAGKKLALPGTQAAGGNKQDDIYFF